MPRVVLVLLSLSVVLPYSTGNLSTGMNVAATNGTTANDTAVNGTANTRSAENTVWPTLCNRCSLPRTYCHSAICVSL